MKNFRIRAVKSSGRMARSEHGGMTAFGLMIILIALTIGGLAVDMAEVHRSETQLQNAADSAAHAAMVTRSKSSPAAARARAIDIAQLNMPPETYGEVLRPEDILFGSWDPDTEEFLIDEASDEGVLVHTKRYNEFGNPVPTFLLHFVGHTSWDIHRSSVFQSYTPKCFVEGFVGQGEVDVTSNNTFGSGFCVHSQLRVKMNNHNTFAPGTIVSTPEGSDVIHGGLGANSGLAEAMQNQDWPINVSGKLDAIFAGLASFDPKYLPNYITTGPVELPELGATGKGKYSGSDFTPGTLYTRNCASGEKIGIVSNETIKGVVLLTNCDIATGLGATLEDVVIATTSTGTISSAGGLTLGRDDGCAPGGGAQILTYGSFAIPSQMSMFGAQLIAVGDVKIAAKPNGVGGASIISGGNISMNTQVSVGTCNQGMENNFDFAAAIRMAR